MAPPQTRLRISNCSLLIFYLPRKDERLSRPGWLTYSGRFTHISGHPSAAGRAQDRESEPVKDCHATKPIYDAILYRLRDIATYWSKIAKFLYHTCIWRPRKWWRRRNFAKLFDTYKTRIIGQPCGEETMTACHRQNTGTRRTCRQTDRENCYINITHQYADAR